MLLNTVEALNNTPALPSAASPCTWSQVLQLELSSKSQCGVKCLFKSGRLRQAPRHVLISLKVPLTEHGWPETYSTKRPWLGAFAIAQNTWEQINRQSGDAPKNIQRRLQHSKDSNDVPFIDLARALIQAGVRVEAWRVNKAR